MYTNLQPIVLASQSPRRREFLQNLGLRFKVVAAPIDEQPLESEPAEEFVVRMAKEKAAAVGVHYPECFTISGDTVVCIGQLILGKPATRKHAVELLMQLAGKSHLVRSGFCVLQSDKGILTTQCVTTRVRFTNFSEKTARAYVDTGEPLDKAGGYGIQGVGGVLVEGIDGSYSNVVGLPVAELVAVLEDQGVIAPVDVSL